MDRVFRTMRVVGKAALTAIALSLMLSCSTTKVETEQKWLSFRCPDGQTVMARFEPQDEFVNVRFAGPRVAPAARDQRLRRAVQRRQDNFLEQRQ